MRTTNAAGHVLAATVRMTTLTDYVIAPGEQLAATTMRGRDSHQRSEPRSHARRGLALALAAWALLGIATPALADSPPAFEKAYTEHLGQLITAPGRGGVNELNNPVNGTFGMRGTDLGASFESLGRLYFLFGDSWVMGRGTQDDDSMAVTDARSVDRFQMPRLTWAHGIDGSFAPLRVDHASHRGMEVPVEGIQANGRTYVFFVSGWHEDTQSYDYQVLGHFGLSTMQTGHFVFDESQDPILPQRQRGAVRRVHLRVRRRQPVSPERRALGAVSPAGDRPSQAVALFPLDAQ